MPHLTLANSANARWASTGKSALRSKQTHFVNTFSGIIREQNFDSFLRYYREGNIRYVGEEIEGDKATVTASIPLERETVTISYDLHRRENQWRIYDLTIDGTSTAEGNRRRYERYIKKKSYEQLIGQLDKQLPACWKVDNNLGYAHQLSAVGSPHIPSPHRHYCIRPIGVYFFGLFRCKAAENIKTDLPTYYPMTTSACTSSTELKRALVV